MRLNQGRRFLKLKNQIDQRWKLLNEQNKFNSFRPFKKFQLRIIVHLYN